MFVGEDQVGHPKVVGQIESHPWASVVERLWEDKQEWEPQNQQKVEEQLSDTQFIVGVKIGQDESNLITSIQFMIADLK